MVTRLLVIVACLGIIATACGDSSSSTTTSEAVVESVATTSAQTVTGGTAPGTSTTTTTSTTAPPFSIPTFTVIDRTPEDVLVVAVPVGTYTDIDLRNLVEEIVESFAPVKGLHIVDDESVAPLVLAVDVSAEEQALLDQHHFLSLQEGFRIVFLGPFSDLGEIILGS